jgi:serine/threonine protein kinase
MNEIEMLKSASHPDIVKIINIYNDPKKLYIVMEYVKGEELYDYIVSHDKLPEQEAKIIIHQLLRIVRYLNSINICHRDLKPENIMIDVKTLKIKLLDFGLSSYFSNKSLLSPVGTPYYVSPEVLVGKYNKECDMWSIGVITYILLTGGPPFQGESLPDIYREIMRFNLIFDDEEWRHVSNQAKEFVERLIVIDTKARMTPDQALEHSWFSNFNCTKMNSS